MSSKAKPVKNLEGKISRGKIIHSSENVFEVETHKNKKDCFPKKPNERFILTRDYSLIFNSPKKGINVRCVYNNQNKEFIEEVYDMRWNLLYKKN